MKKILLLSLLLLLSASSAYATSGACSSHGGVNCSLIGKVYCNDGYSDSSVQYSEMEECKNYKFSCKYEEWEKLINSEKIINIKQKLDEVDLEIARISGELEAYDEETLAGNNALTNRATTFGTYSAQQGEYERARYNGRATLASDLAYRVVLMRAYNNNLKTEINIAIKECESIGHREAVLQSALLLKQEVAKAQEVHEIKKQTTTNLLNILLNSQKYNCPANSILQGTQCLCNEGYVFNKNIDNSACITYDKNCQSIYGLESYGDEEGCHYCDSSHVLNLSTKQCVLKSTNSIQLTREQILIKIKEITTMISILQEQLKAIKK